MKLTEFKEKQLLICHSDLSEQEKQKRMKQLALDYISNVKGEEDESSLKQLEKRINKDYGVNKHE